MAHGAFALRAVRGGTERRNGRSGARAAARSAAVLLVALLGCLTALPGWAGAQAPTRNAVAEAENLYQRALTTDLGREPTPDDGVWRAAIDAAERVTAEAARQLDEARVAAGASSTEALRAEEAYRQALAFTARVYGSVRWHSRAFSHWDAYVAEGGEILPVANPPAGLEGAEAEAFPTDVEFVRAALNQLAFSRYEAGDLEAARAYYLTLLDIEPADPEALRWLARMAFEEGDTATAIQIWGRLVQVAPEDEGARFFLELSRERDEYGAEASEAYRAGIRSYEAGSLAEAFASFERAYAANPDFADAAVWAARSAFELGRPAEAEPYWQAALAADPDDARSAWFLEVTRAQMRWGVAAANDFYAGQTAYADGELDQAEQLFLGATEHNPQYVDAWVWAARSAQEGGRAAEAVGLWQEVLRLDPDDARARHFLQVARQQLAFGPAAGDAFVRGTNAYQVGDVEGARSGFRAAVEAAPDFAAAWSQLGRLEFQVGNFAEAAEAYGRALELEPGNDEYEFFAAEARRLAGLPSEGGGADTDEAAGGESGGDPDGGAGNDAEEVPEGEAPPAEEPSDEEPVEEPEQGPGEEDPQQGPSDDEPVEDDEPEDDEPEEDEPEEDPEEEPGQDPGIVPLPPDPSSPGED